MNILIILGVFIFGLIIGSFLNVVIYRLPRRKSIVYPPSECPSCNTKIKFYDNIPVISYLILGGKCRTCKTKIPVRYPIIELLTGISAVLVYLKWGLSIDFAFMFLYMALMIALSVIDLDFKIIPDEINFVGAVSGFIYAFFRQDLSVLDALLGAVVGSGLLFLVGYLYLKFRKIEGLGLGDVKLMIFIGMYVGWFGALFTIFIGSLLGAVVGILYTSIFKVGDKRSFQLPFGPFLAFASIIYIFFGEAIKSWYLGGMQ